MWELVELPEGKQKIGVKWAFKKKLNPDGSISKHKARLVAEGFLKRQSLDFLEVYAPMAQLETIIVVVAIACAKKGPLFQLYVKSAFLHGHLEEDVYIQKPPGFVIEGREHQVYKLRKALYGLRQAPRAWNRKIDSVLLKMQFTKCMVEHGVYVKEDRGRDLLIICLYVDDLLVTRLNSEFEMTDLGKLSYFLGLEFAYTYVDLVMHQKKYIGEILRKFNMGS